MDLAVQGQYVQFDVDDFAVDNTCSPGGSLSGSSSRRTRSTRATRIATTRLAVWPCWRLAGSSRSTVHEAAWPSRPRRFLLRAVVRRRAWPAECCRAESRPSLQATTTEPQRLTPARGGAPAPSNILRTTTQDESGGFPKEPAASSFREERSEALLASPRRNRVRDLRAVRRPIHRLAARPALVVALRADFLRRLDQAQRLAVRRAGLDGLHRGRLVVAAAGTMAGLTADTGGVRVRRFGTCSRRRRGRSRGTRGTPWPSADP